MKPATHSIAGNRAASGELRRLRPRDLEALRRLQDHGPLTIPQAYDCGHADGESSGHGMNRLVAASLAVYQGWDADENDSLWVITRRGARGLRAGRP
jgi:hypothetical protein